MRIKKGDKVQIMVGKDSGKNGKILYVDTKKNAVMVEGLNVFKKHKRPTRQGEKGQIISITKPIKAANVQLLCPSCEKPTRVGFRFEGEKKVRMCKKCKATI